MGETRLHFSGDDKDLEKAYRKAFDLQEKHIRKVESANSRLRAANNQAKQSADAVGRAYVDVGNLALKGAQVAIDALKKLEDEAEKAAQRSMRLMGARAQLAQVATAERPLKMLEAEAGRTVLESGMAPEAALQMQFALESRKLQGLRSYLAKTHPMVQDPTSLIHGARKLTDLFGAEETGSVKSLIGKQIYAASESGFYAGEIAPMAARIAPGFRAMGSSDEETLAALSVAEGMAPSGEEAATRLKRLGTALMRPEVRKRLARHGVNVGSRGMLAEAEAISSSGISQTDLIATLGSSEAFDALTYLTSGAGEIRRRASVLGEIQSGAYDPVTGMRRTFQKSGRPYAASLEKRSEEAYARASEVARAEGEHYQNTAKNLFLASQQNEPWNVRAVAWLMANVGDIAGAGADWTVYQNASQSKAGRRMMEQDPAFAELVTEFHGAVKEYKGTMRHNNQTLGAPTQPGDRTENDF